MTESSPSRPRLLRLVRCKSDLAKRKAESAEGLVDKELSRAPLHLRK